MPRVGMELVGGMWGARDRVGGDEKLRDGEGAPWRKVKRWKRGWSGGGCEQR